jgi:putative tricarboxylic transport membrane protein
MGRSWHAVRPYLTGERLIVSLFMVILIFYGWGTVYLKTIMRSDVVGPATFPRLITIVGLVLCALYFHQKRGAHSTDDGEPVTIADRSISAEIVDLLPILMTLIYALLFEPLGFPLSTFLYITITMRYLGQDWPLSVVFGFVMMGLIFSLFFLGLMVDIPMGTIVQTDQLMPFLVKLQHMIHG